MVSREMPDPVGSEFGIVTDEITYGADLETAMRNLYFRVGTDDLPLFVTAVAIQGSTGGNLGEILENLSSVIRERFKMRRKIRALAAEGRASALILSSLPFGMFAMINMLVPEFYGGVWHESLTKIVLVHRRLLDGRRQLHHVPAGQFQDLNHGPASPPCSRDLLGDTGSMLMALLVFLAAGTLAFAVMAWRRVARLGQAPHLAHHGRRLARREIRRARCAHSSVKAVSAADRIHHQALRRRQRRAT